MAEIRVIIVGVARLLSDLVEDEISEQPDMTVVAQLPADQGLAFHIRRTRADVVICSLGETALKETFGPLLRERPHLAVLSLRDEARSLLQCELHPRVVACGQVSMPRLLELIRRSARPESRP